ncbi:MAG: hypothetical protein JWO91_2925 [Acidobacteriaceae bacterium]|nr:hypothetical protein [Acidobacteriaceae bacterium]
MEHRNSEGRAGSDGVRQLTYGPRLALITRCGSGKIFELNLDDRQYVSTPYPPKPLPKKEIKTRGLDRLNTSGSKKPTLRIETTTVDMGERKEIFGHTARRVITTTKQIPLEGSHSQPQESVTDGWYIDFDPTLSCDQRWRTGRRAHAYGFLVAGNQPVEIPQFVDIGEAQTGFPLQQSTTSKSTYIGPDGTKKETNSKNETIVTQFVERPLDPALFEIPQGFKRVARIERNPPAPTFPNLSNQRSLASI